MSKQVKFYDSITTDLKAGEYSLEIEQKLGSEGAFQKEVKFQVRAPQFEISATEIHSMHPSPYSKADYSQDIPYVVMKNRMLPWERGSGDEPWMHLLLLKESDILSEGTLTIEEYSRDSSALTKAKDSNTDVSKPMKYVELKGSTLQRSIPSSTEARSLLAHAREVSIAGKVEDQQQYRKGFYSHVIGTRFPQAAITNFVHLISIEGLSFDHIEADKSYKCISLCSWQFDCTSKEVRFREVVSRMIEGSSLMFKMPMPNPNHKLAQEVKERLEKGYVPVRHELRSGEQTMSWYRGFFSPEPPIYLYENEQAEKALLPIKFFRSASSAMIYDEKQGVFDCSYSSAWQSGRTMALSDKAFCVELVTFRSKLKLLFTEMFDNARFYSKEEVLLKNTSANQMTELPMLEGIDVQEIDSFLEEEETAANHTLQTYESDMVSKEVSNANALRTLLTTEMTVGGFIDQLPISSANKDKLQSLYEIKIEKLIKQDLAAILDWFEDFNIHKIPFYQLIPREELLPLESIRFFHVDATWWHAFFDGAFSLAVHDSVDEKLYQLIKQYLSMHIEVPIAQCKWGFIVRSELLKKWPGTEFMAYADSERKVPIKPLFARSFDEYTVTYLFGEQPSLIRIEEPKEATEFGVVRASSGGLRTCKFNVTDRDYEIKLQPEGGYIDWDSFATENGKVTSGLLAKSLMRQPAYLEIKNQFNKTAKT